MVMFLLFDTAATVGGGGVFVVVMLMVIVIVVTMVMIMTVIIVSVGTAFITVLRYISDQYSVWIWTNIIY